MMNFSKYLLPRYFQMIGWLLLVTGFFLGIDRFYFGHKYDWMEWNIFALYSYYISSKYFALMTNNLGEELTIATSMLGLIFLVVSKQKVENESVNQLRIKAIIISFIFSTLISFFANLLLYGFGYVYFLMMMIYIPMVIYYFVFQISYYRKKGELKNEL